MAVNAAGTAYVAHACAAAGCGLLYPSTDYVFDGSGTAPHPVTERPAPLNVYGRSKLLGEQAAQAVPATPSCGSAGCLACTATIL